MEAAPPPTSDHENWAEQFEHSLNLQRERVREFLAAQQQRLTRVGAELEHHVQKTAQELAQDHDQTRQAEEELQQRSERLDREIETLKGLREEWEARQAEWEELQQRAARGQEALAEQIRQQQDELERRHEELGRRQREIDDAEAKLRHDQRALELERGEHEAEAERFAAIEERRGAQQAELDQRDAAEQAELKQQLEAAQRHEGELSAELESLRGRCGQLEKELAEASEEGGGETANEDLGRRYELALEDLRELKAQNAQLEERLDRAPSAGPHTPVQAGETLDWEAQKQRMLAALESDFDGEGEDNEEAADERLTIEGVMQTTDQVLAEKDREIEELKQLLDAQSTNVGSVAVGAAALGKVLDTDAIIQEEREKLKRLQEESREKLRKAEIDISVERAKIARQQAEIEQKLRSLEKQAAEADARTDNAAESGKPIRGRWLAKLGLKETEEE